MATAIGSLSPALLPSPLTTVKKMWRSSGMSREAMIDESETYFVPTRTIRNTVIAPRKTGQSAKSSTAAETRTPFPPLNLYQQGNIWPRTQKKPAIQQPLYPKAR